MFNEASYLLYWLPYDWCIQYLINTYNMIFTLVKVTKMCLFLVVIVYNICVYSSWWIWIFLYIESWLNLCSLESFNSFFFVSYVNTSGLLSKIYVSHLIFDHIPLHYIVPYVNTYSLSSKTYVWVISYLIRYLYICWVSNLFRHWFIMMKTCFWCQ